MGIMDTMREFTRFKEERELAEAEKAVEDADKEYLRGELKKYLYDDSVIDQVLDTFKFLYDHQQHEGVLEILAAKEEEIEKAVAYKQAFETESQTESTNEVDNSREAPKQDVDWVEEILGRHQE